MLSKKRIRDPYNILKTHIIFVISQNKQAVSCSTLSKKRIRDPFNILKTPASIEAIETFIEKLIVEKNSRNLGGEIPLSL